MASLMEELIDTLKKQKRNYEELLILSEEKKSIIMKNDISTLQKISAAENTIIGRNQRLENEREKCVKNIAIVLNVKAGDLTITRIAELIKNQKEHDVLISIRDELKAILEELKVKNEHNKLLIDSSLDYINFSVNIVRSGGAGEFAQYPKSREPISNGKNFFDAKQ